MTEVLKAHRYMVHSSALYHLQRRELAHAGAPGSQPSDPMWHTLKDCRTWAGKRSICMPSSLFQLVPNDFGFFMRIEKKPSPIFDQMRKKSGVASLYMYSVVVFDSCNELTFSNRTSCHEFMRCTRRLIDVPFEYTLVIFIIFLFTAIFMTLQAKTAAP